MDANEIKRGFNSGYELGMLSPALAEKFGKILADKNDPYAEGFRAGVKQCEKERLIKREKNYRLPNRPASSKTKSKDKDRDTRDR